MESTDEIQQMRVSELKDFLKRNGVDIAAVKRSDGKAGPPRKSDLLGAAMHVRADYDVPEDDGPTSPDRSVPRNPFQSGYSPRRSAAAPAAAAPSEGRRPATRKKARRSSVGWVNPAFLAQITPKKEAATAAASDADAAPTPTPPSANKALHAPQVYAQDFADAGDHVIQSDMDSAAGSGVESDTSVIETDDEDDTFVNQFKMMKAYEVRAWLSKHNVQFNHRSKKAELISRACAHALYLETSGGGADAKTDDAEKPHEQPDDDGEMADVEASPRNDEEAEVEVVETASAPPPSLRAMRLVRRPRAASPSPSTDVIEPDSRKQEQAAQTQERPRRRAPENAEDVVTVVAAKKPNAASAGPAPVTLASARRRMSRADERSQKGPRRIRQSFNLPSLTMPPITMQGVKGFLVVLVCTAAFLFGVHLWVEANKPFCDTGAETVRFDGENENHCHPCPPRGSCVQGELTCDNMYRREGRLCVEDSAVSDYANYLEHAMMNMLARRRGLRECNSSELYQFDAKTLKAMFPESERDSCPKHRLDQLRRRKLEVDKFDMAFDKAIEKMSKNEEDVHFDLAGKLSAKKGILTLSCSARLYVRRNFWRVLAACIVALLILRWRVLRFLRKREEARIEAVYEQACEVLRELRINYAEDDKGEAFIRDTELREECLGRQTAESVKLWAKVEKLLRADTRVLHSGPRTIKGMPSYVFEWRGNLRRSLGSSQGIRALAMGGAGGSGSRLSFGSAYRQPSPTSAGINAGYAHSPLAQQNAHPFGISPQQRAPMSPDPAPSPGYAQMLNRWRNQ